ncbi:MAG: hypothetical protein R2751_03960 [Bacteroidales bacterium]
MKRIANIALWILLTAWFAVMLGFVSSEGEKVLCKRIDVRMTDTLDSRFVRERDVREALAASGMDLQGYPLNEINARTLESLLEENPYVRKAEISKDVSGTMEVSIEQRVALVRVMPEGHAGYYLDREGRVLPLSPSFSPRIVMATGHFPEPGEADPDSCLRELRIFTTYLSRNDFWNDQIVQIYRTSKGEYELVPRVGAHQILLGGMESWRRKLYNLELLYKQGLSTYGWNTYGTINLKYTNQVICTKR